LTVADQNEHSVSIGNIPDSSQFRKVQDLSKFTVPSGFRGRSAVSVQLWWFVQSTLFGLSPQVCYGWRNALLRLFGCRVGRGTIIRPSVRITYPWKVSIGERCQIGDNAELYSLGNIVIGDDAVVSQKSYLCTGSHDYKSVSFDLYAEPIVIESEAWVCADVFIYPGVTVGRGAVIAARSTLKDDAQPFGIYAGSPAKLRGHRFEQGN
jgi:putative colanic acid biosynthesis acetyltransferase WcaF